MNGGGRGGGDTDFAAVLLHAIRRYSLEELQDRELLRADDGAGDGDAPWPLPENALKAVEAPPSDSRGCPICLDEEAEAGTEAETTSAWKETACGHRFHGRCVERWLQAKGSCPMCRRRLLPSPSPAAAHQQDFPRTDGGARFVAYRVEDFFASRIPARR